MNEGRAIFDKISTGREIDDRNLLRAGAKLPPVSVEEELSRMELFYAFLHDSPIRKRVEQKLLNRIRRRLKNPDWRPTGVLSGGGYAFYVAVNNRMRRIWRCRQREGKS